MKRLFAVSILSRRQRPLHLDTNHCAAVVLAHSAEEAVGMALRAIKETDPYRGDTSWLHNVATAQVTTEHVTAYLLEIAAGIEQGGGA